LFVASSFAKKSYIFFCLSFSVHRFVIGIVYITHAILTQMPARKLLNNNSQETGSGPVLLFVFTMSTRRFFLSRQFSSPTQKPLRPRPNLNAMAQLAASSSYSVRPAFQSSILHKLFNASEEETTCANQLYLRLDKTNLLSVNFIYRIAHSRLYRLWFLVSWRNALARGYPSESLRLLTMQYLAMLSSPQVATLFFTSTVILYQAEFMQHTVATCVVLVVCVVNLACSLTRIDRHLMRALSQTLSARRALHVHYIQFTRSAAS
jgi:hypothetical protein